MRSRPAAPSAPFRSERKRGTARRGRRKGRARRGALVVVLLLLVAPSFADQADDLLSIGRKAFGDGRYDLAAKSFQRLTDEFPMHGNAEEAGYLLGVSLFHAGDWAHALAALGAFRDRYPGSGLVPRTSYWMGAADLKLGKYAEALEELEDRAVRGADDILRLHAMLLAGVALEAVGKDEEAAAHYRRLLTETSAAALAPEATFRLAGAEYRAARFAAARDLYGEILLSTPGSSFVRDSVFFLAECELALGDSAEADKRYRTVLSLYPDSPYREAASFRLAEIAWGRKNAPQALLQLELLRKEFPDGAYHGSALRLTADIHFDQHRFAEALGEYGKAIASLKEGAEKQTALYSMGLAQLALGRKADAADSFSRAAVGIAGGVAARAGFQSAVLLAGMGKETEAIQALETYIARFPGSDTTEEAGRLLASLLEKSGDKEDALTRWDSLVRGFPGSKALPEYLFRRGSAQLALDRPTAALEDFQKVLKDYPRSPWRAESSYAIGFLYTRRGEYPRALPYFQSAAQDPSAGEVADRSRLSIGIILFNMGSFEKALTSLEDLRARKPKTLSEGTIMVYIGRTLYRMGRLDEAAERLAEAAKMLTSGAASGSEEPSASGEADALYWLGWAELRRGRPVEGRDAFLSLARKYPLEPRSVEALFRAGICETARADDAAAVRLFDEVIAAPRSAATSPIREQALYEQGWALARLGRTQESSDDFDRLAMEYPGGKLAPAAYFKLAEQALAGQRYGEAAAGFQRVARDFPKSDFTARSLYWGAQATWQSGNAGAALNGFWDCLAAGAQAGLLASTVEGFRGALRATGNLATARKFAERAARTGGLASTAVAGIQLEYAQMLLDSGRSEALAVIEEVKSELPPEPLAGEASLLQGRYYAATGDWTRAMDIFISMEGSRADEIGARAAHEHARVLEATGRTSEAIDEFLKAASLFHEYDGLAAEGLYDAVRVSRARGDIERAAKIEKYLRKVYSRSPWVLKLDEH